MFHLSYSVGYIPSEWKTSNIAPVHKKDVKGNFENYLPTSLISLVVKAFERILHEELLNLMEFPTAPTWFLKR